MKYTLFWISGIIGGLLILGGGAWAYNTFFHARVVPDSQTGVFSDIPNREQGVTNSELLSFPASTTIEKNASARILSQLSTRRVAGAVSFSREGTPYVRFTEQGTGHLYEVSIDSSEEERISNTTFPKTTTAVWSPTGNRVAITYEGDAGLETYIGLIEKNDTGSTTLTGSILPKGSHSISFGGVGETLYYAVSTNEQTIGYSRDMKTKKETMVFVVPLSAINVTWEPEPLIVTKATSMLPGYAYRKDLSRIAGGTVGFFAFHGPQHSFIITTAGKNGIPASEVLINDTTVLLSKSALPDKCAPSSTTTLLCAVPKVFGGEFPDSWYRGEVTYKDQFYSLRTDTGEATLIVDPEQESGRSSDVTSLSMSPDDSTATYINKTDATLWIIFLKQL